MVEDYNISVCVLGSGSKGNATYLSDGTTSILIDAGLSGAELQKRMESRGLEVEQLDGIIISHEHADHIKGVAVLSKKYAIPVYVTGKTEEAAEACFEKVQDIINFECGVGFNVNSLEIHPFSVSHDAVDTCGFTVSSNGIKVGTATDMGVVTFMVRENLKGCSLLILEANHDPDMLEEGPYPDLLKERIRRREGHLSNIETKELLIDLKHDGLSHVILAHMSEQNNSLQKVLEEITPALDGCGASLTVATQGECGEVVGIKKEGLTSKKISEAIKLLNEESGQHDESELCEKFDRDVQQLVFQKRTMRRNRLTLDELKAIGVDIEKAYKLPGRSYLRKKKPT